MNLLREKQRLRPLSGPQITSPSSSTRSETKTENVTNATDRRIVADGGATVVGENSTVNITDANSIQKAAELGEAAIINATKVATMSQQGSNSLAQRAIDLTEGAFSEVTKAYSEANKNAQSVASGTRGVLVAGLVLGGLWLVTKMGKKA